MARIIEPSSADIQTENNGASEASSPLTVIRLENDGDQAASLSLDQITFDTSSTLEQDGMDLVITASNGQTIVIEDYFSATTQPDLVFAQNVTLSANMVRSFTTSGDQFAYNVAGQSDESAIGIISEIDGTATITRADGTTEPLTKGSAVYQGDIIETDAEGSVHVTFIDESNFSIGGDARLAIDEFVYDPASQVGTTNISMLRGLFLYTSGLIGKNDPDAVTVDTPVGSIGIRGTVFSIEISGNGVDAVVSIIEGAVVVTNGTDEAVISSQFDAVRISSTSDAVEALGQLPPQQIQSIMSGIQSVNPTAFAAIESGLQQVIENNPQGQDAAQNQSQDTTQQEQGSEQEAQSTEEAPQTQTDEAAEQTQSDAQQNEASTEQNAAEEEASSEENQQESATSQEEAPTEAEAQTNQNTESSPETNEATANEASSETGQTQQNEATQPEAQNQENSASEAPATESTGTEPTNQEQGQQQAAEPTSQQSGPEQAGEQAGAQQGEAPAQQQGQQGQQAQGSEAGQNQPQGQNPAQGQGQNQGQPQANLNDAGPGTPSGAGPNSPVGGNNAPSGNPASPNAGGQQSNAGSSAAVNAPDPFAAEAPSEFSNGNSLDAPAGNQSSGNAPAGGTGQAGGNGSATSFNGPSNEQNDASDESASEEAETEQEQSQIPDDQPFTPPSENTPPQFTLLTSNTADENTTAEEVLATFTVTNTDGRAITAGDIDVVNATDFGVRAATSAANTFELFKKSGVLLDFETLPNPPASISTNAFVQIVINDPDDPNFSDDRNVEYTLQDVNEAPHNIVLRNPTNTASFSNFDENNTANDIVAIIEGADFDTGDTLTYAITGGLDQSFFTITNGNELRISTSADFETQSSYNLEITATDSGSLTYDKAFTLDVADVPEAPTGVDLNNYDYRVASQTYHSAVMEKSPGAYLGIVSAIDQDAASYSAADFIIGPPFSVYMEVIEVERGVNNTDLILKLKDNVELALDGSSYRFKVNGVLQNGSGDPSFALNSGDNEYPLSFSITATDSAAGAATGAINFNIAIKENVLVLDQLGGSDGFIIVNDHLNNNAAGAGFGSSITSGDFNNDGALDLIVGAENARNASNDFSGGAFMFEGNSFDMRDIDHSGSFNSADSTLALSDLLTGTTPQIPGYSEFSDDQLDRLGAAASNIGDINGDGFDDAIVTAAGEGRARVLLGGNGGVPSATFDIVNIPIINQTNGIVTIDYIGDINRDGFNDIIFGSPAANANATLNSGSFTVLYGASTQSSASNLITNAISSGSIDAATAVSSSDGFQFDRAPLTEINAGLGSSIVGIGDFNGDGFDDFAVSEPARDQNGSDSGVVHIFAGNSGGASILTTIGAESGADFLGTTMASIGDINGDGFDDILIGAPIKSAGINGVGQAYVVYGTSNALASSLALGDLNTASNFDGFEIFFGSSANAGADERLGVSMSGIGDFNGDGIDDFIIAGENGEMQNEAFIIYGGAALQSYLAGSVGGNLFLEDVRSSADLGMILNYNTDFDGDNLANQQRITVEGLGDLNQDGFDDLALTAVAANGGQGEVYVVYGRDTGNNVISWTPTSEINASAADQIFIGNHLDNRIFDNGNDGLVAKGNAGDDTFRISNNNFKSIDGGNGGDHDVIHFDYIGAPAIDNIDMRGKDIQNIEEFFIDGTTDTLKLDLDQVLNLLHQSDNKQLRITSSNNVTNTIEFFDGATKETLISNGFTNDANNDSTQDNIIDGGNTYFQFTLIGSDYSVLIDSNIMGANAGGSIV